MNSLTNPNLQSGVFYFLKTAPHVTLPNKAIKSVAARYNMSAPMLRLLLLQFQNGIQHGEN